MTQDQHLDKLDLDLACRQNMTYLNVKKRWDGFAISRVLFFVLVPTFPSRFDNHSSRPNIAEGLKRSDPESSSEQLLFSLKNFEKLFKKTFLRITS